ncbi:unnamed protein product [Microthlaspi erraticum]|uniref:Uncharacterized protein n=1 Tax=Microthlaspi erraticum TaxID=1685480 RepID=A0A6D2IME6_9BRAS|nr:unnamed protein product [Microthlaspi erraticum]
MSSGSDRKSRRQSPRRHRARECKSDEIMPAPPPFLRSSLPRPPFPHKMYPFVHESPPPFPGSLDISDETMSSLIRRPIRRRHHARECKSGPSPVPMPAPPPVRMPAPPSIPRSSLPPPPFPRPPLPSLERVVLENSDETMSRLFPVITTRRELLRETYVLWDMSDYSIPENLDPLSIGKQIQSAITKEGFLGDLQIWLYGAEDTWSPELIDQLRELDFFVYPFKGGKRARLNLIIALFTASVSVMDAATTANLLMLSSNKEEMEQNGTFNRFRKTLEHRGFCVVSAQPETVINPDAQPCYPEDYFQSRGFEISHSCFPYITNALAQQRFKDALNLVRRHRINFNVIVDLYGWHAFLQSAVEFVKQVNNLNHVTEFVCAIKNEDVTETLYKNFSFSKKGDSVLQVKDLCDNKVSSVLQAIRKALEEQIPESPSRELCILTTLARSDPPAIEESLLRIKSVREMELLNSSDDSRKKSCPSAEEALKHLLWLLDAEAVFEAALGLYDLNLAAIVALNSQRDPKEFLPYLQELERMPEALMHFNIDIKLQRFDSALKSIVSAGDGYFPDSMNLMKKNPQLFPLGLQLITDPEKKQAVLEAWADHLTDEKRFEDAATTYLCCSRLEKASKAYRECVDWSGVLRVGALMKLDKDEILKLAYELCEEVNALGKPGEAAKIALEYCGDISGGISLLINAREWEEALRVAFMHTEEGVISVKSSALECASGLVSEFKESIEKVAKYLTRYLAVRQRRLLLAAKLKSEERSVIDLDDDTASEASSNLSGMSAYVMFLHLAYSLRLYLLGNQSIDNVVVLCIV